MPAERDKADLLGDPQVREGQWKYQGLVRRPQSARYRIRRAIKCVTVPETHMNRAGYT
jgi:hypothetical protein